MIDIGSEREVSRRFVAWVFTIGGPVFVLIVVGMAVAHFGYGVPINGEAAVMPPSRDLMIFFPLALIMGCILGLRGVWMLRH
jgi:hypothetical protein